MNNNLLKLQKLLTKYHTEFKDENDLSICQDKKSLQFLQVIEDSQFPGKFLFSIAVDYVHSASMAEIVIAATSIQKVQLIDQFYIDPYGKMTFGEEAWLTYQMFNELPNIADLNPISITRH